MTARGGAIVSLNGVGKTFENGTIALAGLDLEINEGELQDLVREGII